MRAVRASQLGRFACVYLPRHLRTGDPSDDHVVPTLPSPCAAGPLHPVLVVEDQRNDGSAASRLQLEPAARRPSRSRA
jgi:hypothetical protein